MLEVSDLVVRYGNVAAVRGVSLRVEAGELVGLIGPNGAGKSTTIAAIMGLVPIAAGTVTLAGQVLNGKKPEEAARLGIALVPEGRQILASLTVGENLRLGTTVRADTRAAHAEIESVLERFPVLQRTWSRKAGLLSGGEQQQLAVARALVARPRLMLLDEPTLGLSPLLVQEIFDVLETLRQEGMTILVAEQNVVRTIALADRTYVMRTGSLVLAGTRDELAGRADLASLYLGFETAGA